MSRGWEAARKRWGVQHDFREKGDARAKWKTLGTGWEPSHVAIPSCVDFWPMSYRTKREARVVVDAWNAKVAQNFPLWGRFRVVRLTIRVKVSQ